MRLKRLLLSALLPAVALVAAAQMEMPAVPVDGDVRIGRLDNGLTYYIRYNNWPENRAEFYIAQRVGSLQEDEEQRGLAHFLEHMCFNGTEHFKGNDLIRWCETIGVKFGRDLNAYTSIDQTVYNISNVPTERQSALDSCLLILYDWADGLTLDPAEIDKERGVIHEEWRLRSSASQRMFERSLPKLYPGSKYGHRMPIGLMSVIDSFRPQTLRDYYEKWYRPDNQAVIVVGDVDVDHTEAEIKRLFGGIRMPDNPAPVMAEPVPDNAEPIVVIEKDKEWRINSADLLFKHESMPDSLKGTVPYLVAQYVKSTATDMLNARLAEYAQRNESPFVSSSAGDGPYLYSRTVDAFGLDATPKDGKTVEEALQAAYREALRAARYGFTPTEYARSKANSLSALDKMYSNKDKRYSRQFCSDCVDNYLTNEPMPPIDYYYEMMRQVIPAIPVEVVNEMMRSLVTETDTNMVIISFNTEKDGATYPTGESLLKAVRDVRGETLEAYVDNVKDEPLIQVMPKRGKIKKETENKQLGYKELTLSNGVTVVLKHTDYKKDQVLLSADGFGGSSLYGEADYTNIKMFDDVIESSGLGNFSHTELEKALAGKIAGASMSLGTVRQGISGSSTPKDVETLLQLVYLYFTKISKDRESFDNLMKTTGIALKNKALSPESAFNDSLNATMTCHNPRFSTLTMTDLQHVDYDRILDMARSLTANAAAYTFTIVGNFDEDALRPLIEQYIASLPAQKETVKGHNVDTDAKGIVVNSFRRKMETPKAMSVMLWTSTDVPYTLDNSVRMDMAGQILSMIYLNKIREEASAAYTVGAYASLSRMDEKTDCSLMAYCPMKPEKADTALTILRDEVETMAKACDDDLLAKVKEYMLKSFDDRVKTNGYWSSVISRYRDYGVDMHTDYRRTVEAQTPETVSAMIGELLKAGNRIEVVMMPEE